MNNSHSVNFFWRKPDAAPVKILNTGTVTVELGGYGGVTLFLDSIDVAYEFAAAAEEAINLFKIKQLEKESA